MRQRKLKPRRISYWMFVEFLVVYSAACLLFFIFWVNPSLTGLTAQHITADSTTYLYMANVLRQHSLDPAVYIALARFPNTLWVPVFIAYVLNSTTLTVLLNLGIFALSISLFSKSAPVNLASLLTLLLINWTTAVSLLSVNKEIVDLLAVALFCRYVASCQKRYLFFSLLLSLLNRYEVFVGFVAFLILRSRVNPLRRRRWLTLFLFLCCLTVLLPLIAIHGLPAKFAEAIAEAQGARGGGGTVAFLDELEMHYLFLIAAIPKIGENLFGEFLNPLKMANYSFSDLANSYILLSNNLATAFVLFYLWMKGRLRAATVQSDWMYLAMILSLIMSIALVIQPRYFYLVYVLLCFEAAHVQTGFPLRAPLSNQQSVKYA